jgi:hypothetical protein
MAIRGHPAVVRFQRRLSKMPLEPVAVDREDRAVLDPADL